MASCASNSNMHYYLIDFPVKPPATLTSKYQHSLGIEKATAADIIADDRLVYRDSQYEVKFYHYHRWVRSPIKMIDEKLTESLKAANFFKSVTRRPFRQAPDFILHTHIKSLEEWDQQEQWFGRIHLELTLTNTQTDEIVWRQDFKKEQPTKEKKPIAVIEALSSCVEQCLKDINTELDQQFAKLK